MRTMKDKERLFIIIKVFLHLNGPATAKEIVEYLFNDDTITEDLLTEFFASIKSIGTTAFSGTHARWPENAEEYGGFRNKTLYLPSTITEINSKPFLQCYIKKIQLGNAGHPFPYNSIYYSTNNNFNGVFSNSQKYDEVTNRGDLPLDITVYWDEYHRDEDAWYIRLLGHTKNESTQYGEIHFVDA